MTQATLNSIPSYHFGMHRIPKGISEQMDKIRRGFVWGELGGKSICKRKMHLVSLSKICMSRTTGGLGLGKLEARNMAQLAKWWWIFFQGSNRWLKFILMKYDEAILESNPKLDAPMSRMFKDILQLKTNPNLKELISTDKFCWIV